MEDNKRAPEEYFRLGAEAMQSRIVTFLVIKGHMDIAPEVLTLKLPDFQEPEVVTLSRA